jgi:hypothetical protein
MCPILKKEPPFLATIFFDGSRRKTTMDFSFTKEQELFRESVREFCEKILALRAKEILGKDFAS